LRLKKKAKSVFHFELNFLNDLSARIIKPGFDIKVTNIIYLKNLDTNGKFDGYCIQTRPFKYFFFEIDIEYIVESLNTVNLYDHCRIRIVIKQIDKTTYMFDFNSKNS
jgi:hypothetical protein